MMSLRHRGCGIRPDVSYPHVASLQARLDREPQRFFPVQEIALAVDEPETVFAKVVSSHCATIQLPGEVSRQGIEVLPMERGRILGHKRE
jgi:hypothetical protein